MRQPRGVCNTAKLLGDRDDRARRSALDLEQKVGYAAMLNVVSLWRSMKLLTRMQQEETRNPRGGSGPDGPAFPDSDDRAVRWREADAGER